MPGDSAEYGAGALAQELQYLIHRFADVVPLQDAGVEEPVEHREEVGLALPLLVLELAPDVPLLVGVHRHVVGDLCEVAAAEELFEIAGALGDQPPLGHVLEALLLHLALVDLHGHGDHVALADRLLDGVVQVDEDKHTGPQPEIRAEAEPPGAQLVPYGLVGALGVGEPEPAGHRAQPVQEIVAQQLGDVPDLLGDHEMRVGDLPLDPGGGLEEDPVAGGRQGEIELGDVPSELDLEDGVRKAHQGLVGVLVAVGPHDPVAAVAVEEDGGDLAAVALVRGLALAEQRASGPVAARILLLSSLFLAPALVGRFALVPRVVHRVAPSATASHIRPAARLSMGRSRSPTSSFNSPRSRSWSRRLTPSSGRSRQT